MIIKVNDDEKLINKVADLKKVELLSIIQKICLNFNLRCYFVDFPSELNNLNGTWNIFLNQDQDVERIQNDFNKLVNAFLNHNQ